MAGFYKKTIILSNFGGGMSSKSISGMAKIEKNNRFTSLSVTLNDVRILNSGEYFICVKSGDFMQKTSLGNGEMNKGVFSLSNNINLDNDILCVLLKVVNGESTVIAFGSIGGINGIASVVEFVNSSFKKQAIHKEREAKPINEEGIEAEKSDFKELSVVTEKHDSKEIEPSVAEKIKQDTAAVAEEIKPDTDKPAQSEDITVSEEEKAAVCESESVQKDPNTESEKNSTAENTETYSEDSIDSDGDLIFLKKPPYMIDLKEDLGEKYEDETETEENSEDIENPIKYLDEIVVTENYYERAEDYLSKEDRILFESLRGKSVDISSLTSQTEKIIGQTFFSKPPIDLTKTIDDYDEDDELLYFRQVERQLDSLFDTYEHEEKLAQTIEQSKWAKIDFNNDGKYYVVGVIYNGSKPMCICYGVPDIQNSVTPKELLGYAEWLPLDEGKGCKGYWMMYQNCKDGECITGEIVR